ncbi:ATP-binding cassette domain-containing protein [Mycobacterium sp.]|uniref:ATP-binding cassette domain-containing protein n=1 Tax=Mycobacterium sp. TaxID=1785 RepID=UPI0031D455BC
MTGPWGPVYGPIDLDVDVGGVTVLRGPPGSGRTALLATLAGRMKPSGGTVTVLGRTRATDIFAVAALAGIDELDSTAESVTVRDVITEQRCWDAPWYRRIPRAGDDDVAAVCAPVFGDLPPPRCDDFVEELPQLDGLLLRIAVANTGRPPLLVVGSVDQVDSDTDRDILMRRLVELGRHQTVLTASVNPVPAELGVRAEIAVHRCAGREPVVHAQIHDQIHEQIHEQGGGSEPC